MIMLKGPFIGMKNQRFNTRICNFRLIHGVSVPCLVFQNHDFTVPVYFYVVFGRSRQMLFFLVETSVKSHVFNT